jgi:hypothetical protein
MRQAAMAAGLVNRGTQVKFVTEAEVEHLANFNLLILLLLIATCSGSYNLRGPEWKDQRLASGEFKINLIVLRYMINVYGRKMNTLLCVTAEVFFTLILQRASEMTLPLGGTVDIT